VNSLYVICELTCYDAEHVGLVLKPIFSGHLWYYYCHNHIFQNTKMWNILWHRTRWFINLCRRRMQYNCTSLLL